MTHQSKARQSVLARFAKDCAGATAIEYAVIAAGISIAIVGAVSGVGSEVVALFSSLQGIF